MITELSQTSSGLSKRKLSTKLSMVYGLSSKSYIRFTWRLISFHFRSMHQLSQLTNMIIFIMISFWTTCVGFSMFLIAKVKNEANWHWILIWLPYCDNFQNTGNDSIYDLRIPILTTIFPLSLLFIFFYLGQNIHSNSMDLSNMVYQTDWHRYPRSVRRFVLLMILRSQKPFYLSAYGIMTLNYENYVTVSESNEDLVL